MAPTWGVSRKILIALRVTILPSPRAASPLALLYHSGLCSSVISDIKMAERNPASAPPKCPKISMFAATEDIMTTDDNMNRIQTSVLSRLGPMTCQESRISAIQTPINPKPAVLAPTASLKGSMATDIMLPMTPQRRYKRKNFFLPNCFSIPKPMRS